MTTPTTAAPPVILLVTASPDGPAPLTEHLRGGGYDILGADSPPETFRLAVEAKPPLILIDHSPPGIDGPALCASLRETAAGGTAYLLLLTGSMTESHMAAALDSGADDYLLRPFGPDLLQAHLRLGLRAAEGRRQALREREELRRLRAGQGDAAAAEAEGRNKRRAFRVRVAPEAGLRLRITGPGHRAHAAQALDISFTGMLMEPASPDPNWPVGTSLVVDMQLGREAVRLAALVHRRSEKGYALDFPDVMVGGEIEPPEGLRQVVVKLELHWLRTRGRGQE